MYALTTFTPSDLECLEFNAEAQWVFQHVPLPTGEVPAHMAQHPAYTVWRQGEPLACFGAIMDSATSGELWAIVSETAQRYPVGVVRSMWHFLWYCKHYYGLTRLTAQVRTSSYPCQLLCTWLGMEQEDVLPVVVGGEPFLRYVWRR